MDTQILRISADQFEYLARRLSRAASKALQPLPTYPGAWNTKPTATSAQMVANKLIGGNPLRRGLLVCTFGGLNAVIGSDSTVAASAGISVLANQLPLMFTGPEWLRFVTGEIWGQANPPAQIFLLELLLVSDEGVKP